MLVAIEDGLASGSARSPAPAKLISRLAHTKALLRDSLASENAERLRRASQLHRAQLEMVRLRAGRASERAREAVARKSHLEASAKARALSKVADVNSRATFASAAASVRQAQNVRNAPGSLGAMFVHSTGPQMMRLPPTLR